MTKQLVTINGKRFLVFTYSNGSGPVVMGKGYTGKWGCGNVTATEARAAVEAAR